MSLSEIVAALIDGGITNAAHARHRRHRRVWTALMLLNVTAALANVVAWAWTGKPINLIAAVFCTGIVAWGYTERP